jgi:hypothetical protein
MNSFLISYLFLSREAEGQGPMKPGNRFNAGYNRLNAMVPIPSEPEFWQMRKVVYRSHSPFCLCTKRALFLPQEVGDKYDQTEPNC